MKMTDLQPTFDGHAARAWDVTGKAKWTTEMPCLLALWLIYAPTSHPVWLWKSLSIVHLRKAKDVPPAKKHYPEAEYELLLMPLSPDHYPPDLNEFLWVLEGPDVGLQFHNVNDEDAVTIARNLAQHCAEGLLVPDSDFRSHWRSTLLDMVGMSEPRAASRD